MNSVSSKNARALSERYTDYNMQKNIKVEGAEISLDVPEVGTDTCLLFIPGASGGARTDRFAPLVTVALEKVYAIARIDVWENAEVLNTLTLNRILAVLKDTVSTLQKDGFERIILVGKSMGGGIALIFEHPAVVQKIAWAPAFASADVGNVHDILDTPYGSFERSQDIKIGKSALHAMSVPVGIVHGTADTTIPIENSRDIIAALSQGTLTEIPGADHSFKTEHEERELMEATKGLLQ